MVTDRKGVHISKGDKVLYADGGKLVEGRITRIRVEIDKKNLRDPKDVEWRPNLPPINDFV